MAYADLSTWTEVDDGGRGTLTSTSYTLNATTESDKAAFIYKTINSSSDFTITFKVVYGTTIQFGANGNPIRVPVQFGSAAFGCWNGPATEVRYNWTDGASVLGQTHYVKLVRSGNTVSFSAYSDSSFTTAVTGGGYSVTVSGSLGNLLLGKWGTYWQMIPMTISEVDLGIFGDAQSAFTCTPAGGITTGGTIPPLVPWYNAASLTPTTGAIVSGTLANTYVDAGTELVLSEVNGTPGFVYDFTFGTHDPVTKTWLFANIEGWYDGNPAHNVKLQQWNFNSSSWVNVTSNTNDFPSSASEQSRQFSLINDANYLSGGLIKLRLNHSSPGNTSHVFHIDLMELVAGEVPDGGVTLGSTTVVQATYPVTSVSRNVSFSGTGASFNWWDLDPNSWYKGYGGSPLNLTATIVGNTDWCFQFKVGVGAGLGTSQIGVTGFAYGDLSVVFFIDPQDYRNNYVGLLNDGTYLTALPNFGTISLLDMGYGVEVQLRKSGDTLSFRLVNHPELGSDGYWEGDYPIGSASGNTIYLAKNVSLPLYGAAEGSGYKYTSTGGGVVYEPTGGVTINSTAPVVVTYSFVADDSGRFYYGGAAICVDAKFYYFTATGYDYYTFVGDAGLTIEQLFDGSGNLTFEGSASSNQGYSWEPTGGIIISGETDPIIKYTYAYPICTTGTTLDNFDLVTDQGIDWSIGNNVANYYPSGTPATYWYLTKNLTLPANNWQVNFDVVFYRPTSIDYPTFFNIVLHDLSLNDSFDINNITSPDAWNGSILHTMTAWGADTSVSYTNWLDTQYYAPMVQDYGPTCSEGPATYTRYNLFNLPATYPEQVIEQTLYFSIKAEGLTTTIDLNTQANVTGDCAGTTTFSNSPTEGKLIKLFAYTDAERTIPAELAPIGGADTSAWVCTGVFPSVENYAPQFLTFCGGPAVPDFNTSEITISNFELVGEQAGCGTITDIIFNGAANNNWIIIYQPTGVVTVDGTSEVILNVTLDGNGIITFSGSAQVNNEYTGSGTLVFNGNAECSYTGTTHYTYDPLGGVIIEGSTVVVIHIPYTGTATIIISGEATITVTGNATYTATGGITISGTAELTINYNYNGDINIVISGTGQLTIHYNTTVTGGITIGGESGTNQGYGYVANGTITYVGESQQDVQLIAIPTGGITISGTAELNATYTTSGSGTVTYYGTAETDAPDHKEFISKYGKIDFSGESEETYVQHMLAAGSITFYGGYAIYQHESTGTITYTGNAGLTITELMSGTGSITYSGEAAYGTHKYHDGEGTITFSGDATETPTYTFNATGKLTFNGAGTFERTLHANGSGTIRFFGRATIAGDNIFYGGGDIYFSGDGVNRLHIPTTGAGELIFSGEAQANAGAIGSGTITFSGDAGLNPTYDYYPTGLLTYYGAAEFDRYRKQLAGSLRLEPWLLGSITTS